MTNKIWCIKLTSGAWWLCVSNLAGSVGFLFAGISLLAKVDASLSKPLVDVPYLIGSAGFMFGQGLECKLAMKGITTVVIIWISAMSTMLNTTDTDKITKEDKCNVLYTLYLWCVVYAVCAVCTCVQSYVVLGT